MANHETVTRRAALAATAAGVAALGGSEASAQAQTRKTRGAAAVRAVTVRHRAQQPLPAVRRLRQELL